MRLTVVLLGHTFDVSLEPTAADEDDPAAALNGGTLTSSEMTGGFTAGLWQTGSIEWSEPDDRGKP